MKNAVTLSEHKAHRRDARIAAVAALREDLATYAARHGGAFYIFGSAARGELRHDSDVDVLVDFPETVMPEALRYAEDACRSRRLPCDVIDTATVSDAFRQKALAASVALP
ncbi:hypothetical protein OCH239_10795 [Roseivivax halodurans JCM 10272]|uniref:Polymerase nucleotidyl transferase domain-containing protein n=1 Tax=Roseivivax halodurans JCM 10272 TaxID=1449350 RepID=X7EBJ4_9RHOB|nr:nucleotidyltransferase domain-containing protein [Roseivivax halodurans]ETX13322.1 hypothetical protein OCH239_10795 [Roseivivax halodurans JCM 10272]